MDIVDKFAKRLKEIRLEKGITISELADKIGVSAVAISRWERKLRVPDIVSLEKLTNFFGVSADYMLGKADF